MLFELSIKNFAIIEEVNVSFNNGLTVLTGETGAGKSIIIDAIGLLVGGRGSQEFVRHGTDKAEIEGLFHVDNTNHPAFVRCAEYGIDTEETLFILKREIYASGKSVCRVNGKAVTLTVMKDIGRSFVDIHGQHETQDLMNTDRHLALLDQYGEVELIPIKEGYEKAYGAYRLHEKKLRKLTENEQQIAQRMDILQFQIDEIERAELVAGEEEQLTEERNKIANFERIFKNVSDAYSHLSNDNTALDHVRNVVLSLEMIVDINPDIASALENVQNSLYLLEEANLELSAHLDQLEFDPVRLDEIETRLNVFKQLKRKYGTTIEDVLNYYEKIKTEANELENRDFLIEEAARAVEIAKQEMVEHASHLTDVRKQLAGGLIEKIHRELKELYMEKTIFDISFEERPIQQYNATGRDQIEFLISTNPGEPLKPVSKVASGGELSRIMLALKSIFSEHQGVTSIIFDEVDTGVSGRVAQAIAEKMYKVSIGSQVLCISHLPQVAALSDHHLFISKRIEDDRTLTSVRALPKKEKIVEIARMISGVEITPLTEQHALEMLSQGDQIKATYVH